MILINGAEVSDPETPELLSRHLKMNAALMDFVIDNEKRVKLLDVRDIVKSRREITDHGRHYKPEVYKKLADKLIVLIESESISKKSFFRQKYLLLPAHINKVLKVFLPVYVVKYLSNIYKNFIMGKR